MKFNIIRHRDLEKPKKDSPKIWIVGINPSNECTYPESWRKKIDSAESKILLKLHSEKDFYSYSLVLNEKDEKSAQILNIHTFKIKEEEKESTLKTFFSCIYQELKRNNYKNVGIFLSSFCSERYLGLFTQYILLGSYEYYKFKTQVKEKFREELCITWFLSDSANQENMQNELHKAMIMGNYVNLARDFGNAPPNELYSVNFAKDVVSLVKNTSVFKKNKSLLKVEVWNKEKIAKEKMRLLLAVNAGSLHEPRVVKIHFKPKVLHKNSKHIYLVGEGELVKPI